jgi:AcrR family transcriptional regulator
VSGGGRSRPNARAAILAAFARSVAARGYSDTSIGDLAEELGISKGTVVHHFKSKQVLLDIVVTDYMQRRMREAHHVLATLATPAEQLAGMVYALLLAHLNDRDATRVTMRELVRYLEQSESGHPVRGLRDTYTGIIVGIVERGIADGSFRDEDPNITTLQVFGMCNYAWTWYRPEGSFPIQAIANTFVRTLLSGLRTPTPGQELGAEGWDELMAKVRAAVESARV